jgi:hypothetical protein
MGYYARRRGATATAYWLASDMVINGSSQLVSWADRINGHNMGPQGLTGATQVTTGAGWKAINLFSGTAACTVAAIGAAAEGFKVFSVVFRMEIVSNSIYLGWTTSGYVSKHTIQTTGGTNSLRCRRYSTTTNAFSDLAGTYAAGTYTMGLSFDGTNYKGYQNGTLTASGVAGTLSVDTATDRFAFLTGATNYVGAVKLWVGTAISDAQQTTEHGILAAACP